MKYLLVVLAAYLIGCSNMALYIAKARKVDLKKHGSGNPGASNAAILMGWRAGVAVAVHDIGKAWLAVFLAGLLFPQLPAVRETAGIACVLGHIFPFYMRFKGGKGFASYLGMTLALNWKFALVLMAVVLLVTVIGDYIVVGTFTTIAVVPVYFGFATHSLMAALVLLAGSVAIFCRHWENIQKLRAGTEIGLRSTIKKEHRVK